MLGMRVIVLLSSTRVGPSYTGMGSWGDRLGNVIKERVESFGHKAVIWDPKVLQFPLLQQPYQMHPNKSNIPAWLTERKQEIEETDAFIACCAEYNASIPPAFANMLDHFPPASFKHRPVGVVTYSVGTGGGIRVQAPLKTLLTEMGMITVPAMAKVDSVSKKFDDNGSCLDDKMKVYIDRVVAETLWYAEAISSHKQSHGLPSV